MEGIVGHSIVSIKWKCLLLLDYIYKQLYILLSFQTQMFFGGMILLCKDTIVVPKKQEMCLSLILVCVYLNVNDCERGISGLRIGGVRPQPVTGKRDEKMGWNFPIEMIPVYQSSLFLVKLICFEWRNLNSFKNPNHPPWQNMDTISPHTKDGTASSTS